MTNKRFDNWFETVFGECPSKRSLDDLSSRLCCAKEKFYKKKWWKLWE